MWTYSLDDIHKGLQGSYSDLTKDVQEKYGVELTSVGALGISAMMHGYMPFDKEGKLRVPFRTWRNNITGEMCIRDRADSGTLKVNGKEAKIGSPLDAMKLGMAYLPEDRKAEGIIADLSVRENIIIALQAKRGMFHPLSRKEMEEAADKYIEMLQIKTASRETPIKSLSGGNQQKVILGRWLLTNPEYLILDEPTRGIDIGTKTEIQKICLLYTSIQK